MCVRVHISARLFLLCNFYVGFIRGYNVTLNSENGGLQISHRYTDEKEAVSGQLVVTCSHFCKDSPEILHKMRPRDTLQEKTWLHDALSARPAFKKTKYPKATTCLFPPTLQSHLKSTNEWKQNNDPFR